MIYKTKWMLAVSLIAGWALTALPALGQTQVVVTNATNHPVPVVVENTTSVAGTVSIGNTPSVAVSNTPTVNVGSMPSVNIAGTPTVSLAPGANTNVTNPLNGQNNPLPLAATEGAQFYQDRCFINFSGSGSAGCTFSTIPSNYELVIQEFDLYACLSDGAQPATIFLSDGTYNHYFPSTQLGTWGCTYFATHQPTHLYIGASIAPTCSVLLATGTGNNGYGACNLSGFLVAHP